ncbi:MAG: CBS domain-containing protein [Rubrivivax sp.]
MDLKSLCHRPIVTIEADRPLQQAALLMREQHVGALVIVDNHAEGPHAVGIVTDRDLAIEVLARGGDVSQVPVGRLGGAHVVSAPETAGVVDAIGLMQGAGVRRLLVRDAEGHLVGLLSFDDLLQACVAPLAGLAEVLRKGLERETAERGTLAAAARPRVRVPAMGTAGWTQRF